MPDKRVLRILCLVTASVAVAGLLLTPAPVAAIYYGVPDFEHTNVGAILDDDPFLGVVFLFCSGTLIAERVFLTAGHCTSPLARYMAMGDTIWVGFDQDVLANPKSWYRVVALYTHPEFSTTTGDYHDLGVAILEKAVRRTAPAAIAPLGYLDRLDDQGLLRGYSLTTVGYGVTEILGEYGLRKAASSNFLALSSAWLYLGQNSHVGYGGACGGDSGGPVFYEDGDREILVATTSWGDGACLGMGAYYRLDTPSAANFLAPFLASAS